MPPTKTISKRASEYLRNSSVEPAVMSFVAMVSYSFGGMGRRWERRASRKTVHPRPEQAQG
jgi:hypothetical protein